MDNVLRMLSMARKAGRIEIGEEPVGAAARSKHARVILVAADAADNTVRRAKHFAELGSTVMLQTPYLKAGLGGSVGRTACAMVALTDAGMAAAVARHLAAQDAGKYGEAAELLDQKAAKMLQRQREKRQHEKNVQRGKQKPWAAPAKEKAVEKSAAPSKKFAPKSKSGSKEQAAPAKAGRPMPRGRITVVRKSHDAT